MCKLIKIFKDYRLFEILIFGIISGMPLAILYTSLVAWLKDSGIDISIITTFAVARISYSLKIFWAPIVDYFKIPFIGRFGHRKSWLILCSGVISLILFLMSKASPRESLSLLYFLTMLLGFCSATFDISVDALRIEKFDQDMQGIASATAVLGYRIGCTFVISAGSLYCAEMTSWSFTFRLMSILFIISILFIMTVREKPLNRDKLSSFNIESFFTMILVPFKDFFIRKDAVIILSAVILFKLGDAMLGVVATPFYMELGYTKVQIALVAKSFGFFSTLFGSFVGGIVLYKLGNFRGLMITGILQSMTHFAFLWLNHQEVSNQALLVAISIENFACAMGATALVCYISYLCNKKYSATQYALLSGASSLCNNTVTMYCGSLVKLLGWDNFFIFTVILAVPALIIIYYLDKKCQTNQI